MPPIPVLYVLIQDYLWTYQTKEINGEEVTLGIDAISRGNYLRFINHKGEARNAIADYLEHDNLWHVIYIAAQDIKAGEEITTDYGSNYFESRI